MLPFEGMTERDGRVDRVPVASSDLLPGQVPGLHQITDDPLGGPFGDPDPLGEIANAGLGIAGKHDDRMSVVGQEGPLSHSHSLALGK